MESLGIVELIKKSQQVANQALMSGGGSSSVGDDPITIFTLLSELQREAEACKKESKKWEERASTRETQVRQEQTQNEAMVQQIEELQI